MLILCDSKIPRAAKSKLESYGEVVEFATEGITYGAISGHPDIFFCPTPGGLIVAPNLPEKYFSLLVKHAIPFKIGYYPVGHLFPETAHYNTLVTSNMIIQNSAIADLEIRNLNPSLKIIEVKQGYVRCNLVGLPDGSFLSSDRGIEKSLKKQNVPVVYIDSSGVKLDGFEHGFFGGACGFYGNTLFICGRMHYFDEKLLIEQFVSKTGVRIVELYDGWPVDVGTIMFL